MKINKKVLIPVFATAMGLSVIGGISGAVAWYQYNSKVSASFVGTSVSDTGVLQIGTGTDSSITWGRDYAEMEGKKFYPVTFGALETLNAGQSNEKQNVLPANAYHTPEAGAGEGYANHNSSDPAFPHWQSATAGTHYAQFSLYFRASETDPTDATDGRKLVARRVYLSDFILKCVNSDGTDADSQIAKEAIRIHMDIENGQNRLFSNTEVENLALSGGLDLDNSGHADSYHSTLFNNKLGVYGNHPENATGQHDYDGEQGPNAAIDIAGQPYWDGEEIVYGKRGDTQTTEALSSVLATRDSNGKIQNQDAKALFITKADEEATPIKVTFTIWLEGWATLGSPASNIWNPNLTAGCDIQVGLRFDSGIFRDADLGNTNA